MERAKIYGVSRLIVDLGPGGEKLIPIAQDVAIQRGMAVAEAFFHFAAIRSLQRSPVTGERAHVQCVAAHVQDTGARSGQQAAHLLPGQILVGGRPIWLLAELPGAAAPIKDEIQRLSLQTQVCFAKTNVLPAAFNRADSQAEGSGHENAGGAGSSGSEYGPGTARALKQLFGSVVQRFWRAARVDPARPLAIDKKAVLAGVGSWFAEVNASYSEAAARKQEAARKARAERSARAEEREMEATILATYAQSFKIANAARFVLASVPHMYDRYPAL